MVARKRRKARIGKVKRPDKRLRPKVTVEYLYRGNAKPERHGHVKRALGYFASIILLIMAVTAFYDMAYYGSGQVLGAFAYDTTGATEAPSNTVFAAAGFTALVLAVLTFVYAWKRKP